MSKTSGNSAWDKLKKEFENRGISSESISMFKEAILTTIDEAVAEAKFKERVERLLQKWVPTVARRSITNFSNDLIARAQKLLDEDEPKVAAPQKRKKQTRAKQLAKKK